MSDCYRDNPLSTAILTPANVTWQQEFDYDRYGNREFNAAGTTTIAGCSPAVCDPEISPANNRFSAGQGYTYDPNGAVTQDATGQRFGYDAEGRKKGSVKRHPDALVIASETVSDTRSRLVSPAPAAPSVTRSVAIRFSVTRPSKSRDQKRGTRDQSGNNP